MFGIGVSEVTIILLFMIVISIFYLAHVIRLFGIGVGHCYIAQEKNLDRIVEQLKEISAKMANK